MIEFQNVSKTFQTKQLNVHALQDVSFKVKPGEIFGVIGFSGAGKSTLVRCINLLERPESGKIIVNGIDVKSLNPRELRNERRKIGMIFQGFNLLNSRTVYENIAFPLRYKGKTKHEIKDKVESLLELVGIADKRDVYPSQLSGGQKQRVAIARALANDPDILLCDEATSALDPQTTQTILRLLKEVNERLGITIVIITHEMAVVKTVCDRVAVMENGHIKELDAVTEIFANPQASITKDFVDTTTNLTSLQALINEKPEVLELDEAQQLVRLDFRGNITQEAIISEVSLRFNVKASIVFANVEIVHDEVLGILVVILTGERQIEALEFLKATGVKVEVFENDKRA
ncbi:methionine ABC transporter ATP-binding protein [Erysipelothrix aquatica]|uniref:methionine ABC transporter ATP-binding protein n=1 Tax=Erysipelothrix aquatica TaxID=2683714 RepID=UPI00135AA562|nr:ATP-binding cassette domain-containing protein [Erysipelothrix aquatica]